MVTLITAICGAVFGFAALLLNLASFLRDRARLVVTLAWDQRITGTPTVPLTYDPRKLYGVAGVTNVGRRPAYLATVALQLPDRCEPILGQSFKETRLAEGDPPALYLVDPDPIAKYAAVWDQVRVIATDSSGQTYKSRKVRRRPSWADLHTGRQST